MSPRPFPFPFSYSVRLFSFFQKPIFNFIAIFVIANLHASFVIKGPLTDLLQSHRSQIRSCSVVVTAVDQSRHRREPALGLAFTLVFLAALSFRGPLPSFGLPPQPRVEPTIDSVLILVLVLVMEHCQSQRQRRQDHKADHHHHRLAMSSWAALGPTLSAFDLSIVIKSTTSGTHPCRFDPSRRALAP